MYNHANVRSLSMYSCRNRNADMFMLHRVVSLFLAQHKLEARIGSRKQTPEPVQQNPKS